jgi:hypothetical protein
MKDAEIEAVVLTKGQRRFLQRRYCGWCEARIDSDTCHAMYGTKCTRDEMRSRRDQALATYRPRARLAKEHDDGQG